MFAILPATLLYSLVLLLLDGYPFTGKEFELYYTMLLTIWLFLVACKAVLAGITLLEKIIEAEKAGRINLLLLFKKIAIPLLAIFICYASFAQHLKTNTPGDSRKNFSDSLSYDPDINFLVKLPS